MRIGLFIDSYHPKINGVITSVDSLKAGLEKLGHEVYIITGGNVSKPTNINHIIFLPSINCNPWNLRLINPYSKQNINFIESLNLDIIHSHTELTLGILSNNISKKNNTPRIHSYHTMYSAYTYYVFHNIFHAGDLFLDRCVVNNFCRKNIDHLIVPSEKIADELRSKFHLKTEPTIIRTGIDQNSQISLNEKQELKTSFGLEDNDFIILYAGRIAKEKNLEFLVKCQEKINKIDANIKLLFVGDGPFLSKLNKCIVKTNTIDNIKLVGKIDPNEIYKYYQLVDLMVTSSQTETQGLTILESLQNGTPALCVEDSAFDYLIQDGYNGYFFQSDDDYIGKIIELKRNKDSLLRLKQNCIESSEKFSSLAYAKNVEKVYINIKKRNSH